MGRTDRLFALAALLKGRRVHTAAGLAGRLGVSVRTLYRDVDALRDMGVPVSGAPGVGFRLAADADLPPVQFSRAELEALVLGARMVETWADPALADAARAALARVEAVLPAPLREVLLGVPLYASDWAEVARPAALGTLREAIHRRHRVHFGYADKAGAPSTRTVRPLALHFWGQKWTLAAWCELRADFRGFRVDRMDRPEVGAPFPDEPGRDLEAFLARVRADGRPGR